MSDEPRDRLVVDLDLVALDGAAELLFQHHQFGAVVAHRAAEDLDAAIALALGFVERDGGILEQLLGRQSVFAVMRHADARGEEDLLGIQHDRAGNGAMNPLGEGHDVALALGFGEEDGELVARQPGNAVQRAGLREQPPADHGQQSVAGLVAQRIVDDLEAVDVDQQHIDAVIGVGTRQGAGQAVEEQGAVGQARHPVVDGIGQQPLLAALGDGDVGEGADAARRAAAMPGHGPRPQHEPAILAIAVQQAELLLD